MFGTRDRVDREIGILSSEELEIPEVRVDGQEIANRLIQPKAEVDLSSIERLRAAVERCNQCYEMHYYHEMQSSVPVLGKLVIVFKKIVRRFLLFLMQPMVEEQTAYHMAVTRALNEMNQILAEMDRDTKQAWTVAQMQENRMADVDMRMKRCEQRMHASTQQKK